MTRVPFGIRGTGSYVPEGVLTNADLSKIVDTSDDWIVQRTGIRERHVVREGETTSTLCVEAARRALADADMDASEIDLILLATVTPDQHVPATSCLIQQELGIKNAPAFDMQAGCTGFVYGTSIAAQYLWTGTYKNILVIGAESLSRIADYTDRGSSILFGDGAGAVIYSSSAPRFGEVRSCSIEADGGGYDVMHVRAGGAKIPLTHELLDDYADKLVIHGRQVYQFAVRKFVELVRREQEENPDLQLAGIVPHQMNQRIIEAARERMDLPEDAIYVNIDRMGNTSAASVPLALDEAIRNGWFDDADGKLIVMCSFGAGLTWGSVGMKW